MMIFSDREIQAYKKMLENEIRFETLGEFIEFSNNNFVFYPLGFGYRIQTLIETEEQFIDFVQRACIEERHVKDGFGLMWFVNDYTEFDKYFEYVGGVSHQESNHLLDGETEIYEPTELITAYSAEYNEYFEKRFAVHKTQIKIFAKGTLKVKQRIIDKMPFIARFCSMDTYDRCGSIKGNDMEIIAMSDIKAGQVCFC
jgi:hypothetical protein